MHEPDIRYSDGAERQKTCFCITKERKKERKNAQWIKLA